MILQQRRGFVHNRIKLIWVVNNNNHLVLSDYHQFFEIISEVFKGVEPRLESVGSPHPSPSDF